MDGRILQLADGFADAAVDPSRWMDALQALAEATGSARGQLIGIGGDAAVPFNWVNDFPQHAFDEFVAMDGGSPLVNPRVAAALGSPVLAVRSEADYREVRPLLASDIYLDFCRDYDLPHGCQTKLFESDGGLVGLAMLRREADGETEAQDRALFAAVAPYVRSAVRMQMALEKDAPRLVAGALDQVAAAVFICARDGQVLARTQAAQAIVDAGRLAISAGTLRLAHRAEQDSLVKAIARHGAPIPAPLETLTVQTGTAAALPLLLDIVALPRGPWTIDRSPRVLVIARGAGQWHSSAPAVLQALFALSPAEADVALRLARGQPRTEIAGERSASLETVRSQIKLIFAKLGIAREVELVAMLGQLLRC